MKMKLVRLQSFYIAGAPIAYWRVLNRNRDNRGGIVKLQHLEVFSTVTRHLNLSRTARELHVTPSAVSHVIRKLEKDLGVKLTRQTRRGIELTDSGSSIRSEIDAILSRIKALEN